MTGQRYPEAPTDPEGLEARMAHEPAADRLLAHLRERYGIEASAATRVSVHKTYVFRIDRHDGGSWVARAFPPDRHRASVEGDAAILGFLEAQGYPAERVAVKDAVSDFEGSAVLVTRFVDGTELPDDAEKFAVMGDLLGRLHALPADEAASRPGGASGEDPRREGAPRQDLLAAGSFLDAVDTTVPAAERDRFERLRDAVRRADDGHGLPEALLHGNLLHAPDHALLAADGPVAINWTASGRGPRLADFAYLIWGTGAWHPRRPDPERITAAVTAYRRHIELSDEELERLEALMYLRTLYLTCFAYRRAVVNGVPFRDWGFIRPREYFRETAAAVRDALGRSRSRDVAPAATPTCQGAAMTEPSFPRQNARTRRFTLGAPRGFQISPDGERILFLRSRDGEDPVNCLWSLDVAGGEEHLVVDPRALLDADEQLPPEEAARRERVREQASGVVAFATDTDARTVAFALSGRLWIADAHGAEPPRELSVAGPVLDPRPDPTGTRVAYVAQDALHVADIDGGSITTLAQPDGTAVSWGLPEFVAAEEMARDEGYWWSPAGDALLAARVDISGVAKIVIADPAHPDRPAREVAYPFAGTPNADVSLWLLGLDGSRREVVWDRQAFEYLVTARWSPRALLIVVQSRDQRRMQILEVDPATGKTSVRREDADPVYLDIVAGVPAFTASGELVWTVDADDTRRLQIGDQTVTPEGLHVRAVLDVDDDVVLFTASQEPTEIQLWTASPTGAEALTAAPGVHGGRRAGATTVVVSRSLGHDGARVEVHRGGQVVADIPSLAQTPVLTPRVQIRALGSRELRTAILLPSGHERGSGVLPVLLDPYGGPAMQRVLADRAGFLTSQWFADQGFAVLVIDGAGTPGRGHAWERSIRGDFATPVLEDQVQALHEAARAEPDLDLTRVAIRGWSFGGYLAALAVLRRPDVFHAAVAGAPVTDNLLYDTHYKERYLGDPRQEPANYERCSLIDDAPNLTRPLLLIHGLADDNVLVAHTLRLSAALTAAGRPHSVLPLIGVTHMTPQPEVAENRLALELEFLTGALGIVRPAA